MSIKMRPMPGYMAIQKQKKSSHDNKLGTVSRGMGICPVYGRVPFIKSNP